MSLSDLVGIAQASVDVAHFIRFLLDEGLVLESERFDDAFVAFLVFFGLSVQLLFQTSDASQILLLLQQNAVPLQIGVLNPLLALISQLLDRLLLLFIQGDSLLLILKQ